MLKLEFTNATAEDSGYGLEVNGKSLEHIISTALGTRVDSEYGRGSGLKKFKSNCCNITIIIDPKPQCELIENDVDVWHSVKELEEDMREQFKQKTTEAES